MLLLIVPSWLLHDGCCVFLCSFFAFVSGHFKVVNRNYQILENSPFWQLNNNKCLDICYSEELKKSNYQLCLAYPEKLFKYMQRCRILNFPIALTSRDYNVQLPLKPHCSFYSILINVSTTINSGANVSRGHRLTVRGSIQVFKWLFLCSAVLKQSKPKFH